jgi:hypothetical protein
VLCGAVGCYVLYLYVLRVAFPMMVCCVSSKNRIELPPEPWPMCGLLYRFYRSNAGGVQVGHSSKSSAVWFVAVVDKSFGLVKVWRWRGAAASAFLTFLSFCRWVVAALFLPSHPHTFTILTSHALQTNWKRRRRHTLGYTKKQLVANRFVDGQKRKRFF